MAVNMGENFGDVPHGFSSSLPEHHSGPRAKVFRIFDETEETCGFVTSSEVLLVHGHNGGSLLRAAAVDCVCGGGRVSVCTYQ